MIERAQHAVRSLAPVAEVKSRAHRIELGRARTEDQHRRQPQREARSRQQERRYQHGAGGGGAMRPAAQERLAET
jgi:hypothetical protein